MSAYHHINTSFSSQDTAQHTQPGSSSPVAPAYSPITPKVQPILPVSNGQQQAFVPPPENGGAFTFSVEDRQRSQQSQQTEQTQPQPHPQQPPPADTQKASIPPTEYIPKPPNEPFSGDDATDAIALRAAISTLQFQKQKAKDDLKTLSEIKKLALDDPSHFKEELAAGRLSEQRSKLGDIRAILDEPSDEDSDDEVVLGAEDDGKGTSGHTQGSRSQSSSLPAEVPDSQPSQTASKSQSPEKMDTSTGKTFPRIPGPQDVVRMPYVNWEKYHIVGAPLESMHEQQKRWPGDTAYNTARGREHTIAAPYSPFLDDLEAHPQRAETDGPRKDSAATPITTTPNGTISEHPMATRGGYSRAV